MQLFLESIKIIKKNLLNVLRFLKFKRGCLEINLNDEKIFNERRFKRRLSSKMGF